jgi:hypothetical protein
MDATTQKQDPVELIQRLDAAAIRTRLAELARERQALLVLLRASRRFENGKGVARA